MNKKCKYLVFKYFFYKFAPKYCIRVTKKENTMPGIEWVNTVDNRSFVQGMNEMQASFRRTSEILKSLGQNFNIDGIVNQYISLTKVIQDNEVAIRQSRESVLRWQEEAQKARDTGDFGTAETIQIDIDNELQKIQQLSEETDEYKRSVNELMGLWSNLEGKKAPMLFNSQAEYDHVQKLKAEISDLQSQIANFNGSDADLEALNGRLTELNDELNKSEISAAQNAANLGSLGPAAADASNKYYELTNKIKEQKIKVAELTIEHEKAKKAMKEANSSGNLQAITDARTKYDALSQALINARHQLTNYQIEQSKVAGGIKNEAFSINSIVSQLKSSAMSLAGGLGIALGAKEFVGQVVGIRGQFQQLEIAFETMLGSGEKAKELLGQLTETAAKTPFDLQGVAQGAKQLMAYGISADEVNDTLVHLGDIAAGLSLPLGDLVYLYGTTMTQGRMFTQDLRQFMGRGIPIAEELAKIFNTTKENVGALVTAGKVGADEFKQAIMAMSSEGGKFAGLMENQSKTITGQISNIQDSIDVMFNKIGQNSEGIINGTLDVVSSLVENYEKVGKVIAGIVATYGTYRAALMTVTALQGLQTAGVGALTAAETAHYGWLVLCEKAQKLLNVAMSVNPYVLVATAVAGLVSTMMVFHEETESVSDVIERSNSNVAKSFNEVDAQIKIEQQSIDELFDKLRKAEKGTNEYKEVKDQILSQYGKYLQGLNNEISTLNDVEGAYKAVAKAARDAALARGKEAAISQANSEYTKNYSDAMGKIYDIIKDKRGEQIAKTAIDVIKKDLKDVGEVAEDTQRTLHKYGVGYSLFGDLNKAEQGLKASTSKINLLFGEQKKVVAETSENVTKLSEDYAKAETRYKRAQGWVQTIEKNKADYTTKEYQDALEDLKEAKSAYEKIGGKTSNKVKAGSSSSNAQTFNAKRLQDQWKHEQEMSELEEKAARAREDALIAAEQNVSVRERKEREEQHKRAIVDINRQEQDTYKVIYEQRKRQWELTHKDSLYENTPEGKAGYLSADAQEAMRKSFTDDEKKLFDARDEIRKAALDKENAEYARYTIERQKTELQSMRDYLKEYGTFEEKKLAITQDYEQRIADEQDPSKKAGLMMQRDRDLENLSSEQAKQQIDWDGIFSDLQGHTKEYLESLRSQLQSLISSGTLKLDEMEVAQGKIRDINALISEQSGIFSLISPLQIEYNRRLQEEADAKELLEKAKAEQSSQEAAVSMLKALLSDFLNSKGQEVDGDINGALKNPFKQDSDDWKKFNDIIAKLRASESKLADARDKTARATQKAKNAEDSTKETGQQRWARIRENIESSKAFSNVSSAPELLKNIGLGEAGEKAQKGLDGMNDAMGAVTDYMSGNYIGALSKGVSAITNFGEAFGLWSNSNRAEVEAANAKLEEAMSVNTEAVNRLTDAMEKSSPQEAYQKYQEALAVMQSNEDSARQILLNNASMYDGGHSLAYDFNDDEGRRQLLSDIGRVLGKRVDVLQDLLSLDASTLNRLYESQDGRSLLKRLGEAFSDAQDEGNYNGMFQDLLDYMNQFSKEAYEELDNILNQSITGVSFDSFKDKFKSSLMDMKKDAASFSDDFTEMLMQSILNAKIEDLYGDEMEELYNGWVKALDDNELSDLEVRRLQEQQDGLVQRMMATRDMLAAATGYGTSTATDQTATASMAEKVTYDQMDEFTGILRATQIAVERGFDTRQAILTTLQSLQNVSVTNPDVTSIRLMMETTNDYLLDIKRSNRSIYNDFAQKMNDIIERLENIG